MTNSSPTADNKKTAKKSVILITGASSGIGAGMAKEFAQRGSSLALCARRTENLDSLKADIHKNSPEVTIENAALDVNNHQAVFDCFADLRQRMGTIDRIIVNAGIGTGAPIGKGGFQQNLATIETNYVAALAQAEAAMEIFRDQGHGHLIFVSSMSAMRGLRGAMTAYSSSKAAVAALAEGIRADVLNKPKIKVTTLFPGYIRTELNAHIPKSKTPFIIDSEKGARLLVNAIEREPAKAYIPHWPWAYLGAIMKSLPLSIVNKIN